MRTLLISVLFALAATFPTLAAVTHSGGSLIKVTVVTETNGSTTSLQNYVQLPGAVVHITVAPGTTQLVRASFTAKSLCAEGNPGNWCSIRIVAVNAAGSSAELSPKSGLSYAFDTVTAPAGSDDGFEGNAMDRSVILGSGDYAIRVQMAAVGGSTIFALDDWSFTVEQHSNGL